MGMNVLICDDSQVMRRMEARAMKMTGIQLGRIEQVTNGLEALEKLAIDEIDLLLLDVNMPELDGVSTLERIRGEMGMSKLIVVAVTSEGGKERLEALTSMEASIVRKPFTAERLVDGIVRALGGSYGLAEVDDDVDSTDF